MHAHIRTRTVRVCAWLRVCVCLCACACACPYACMQALAGVHVLVCVCTWLSVLVCAWTYEFPHAHGRTHLHMKCTCSHAQNQISRGARMRACVSGVWANLLHNKGAKEHVRYALEESSIAFESLACLLTHHQVHVQHARALLLIMGALLRCGTNNLFENNEYLVNWETNTG